MKRQESVWMLPKTSVYLFSKIKKDDSAISLSHDRIINNNISRELKIIVGLFFSFLIILSSAIGQNIGINATGTTPNASAMLDVSSSNSGLLLPRVALQDTSDVTTIVSPATSLLVYNTNASMAGGSIGFYYYSGIKWQLFYTTENTQWTIMGNTGTNPSTNFIGTIDAEDFVIKTLNIERMRVASAGTIGMNAAPTNTELLTIAGTNMNGINVSTASTSGTGYALHAMDTATDEVFLGYTGTISIGGNPYKKPIVYSNAPLNAGSGGTPAIIASSSGTNVASAIVAYSSVSCGILSYSSMASNAASIWGMNTNSSGTGVIGVGNNIGNATYAPGGSGGAFKGDSVGVFGYITAATGKAHGFAIFGQAGQNPGNGIVGTGNNISTPTVLTIGSGGAFNGDSIGSFSYSTKGHGYGAYNFGNGAYSTGIVGVGNSAVASVLASGAGGQFFGTTAGIYASATNTSGSTAAITCFNGVGNVFEYLNYNNGTNYKILQSTVGAVSCSVKDLDGKYVVMHCPETPEFYFQDYGQGQLINGFVHINLDPVLARNVAINSRHPLRVFIQLEDNENCKGVIVKNKTATGFDVQELNGGASNTPFQYQIICNVADAEMPSGIMSKFQDLRFEPAPDNPKIINGKIDFIQHPDQKMDESIGIPK